MSKMTFSTISSYRNFSFSKLNTKNNAITITDKDTNTDTNIDDNKYINQENEKQNINDAIKIVKENINTIENVYKLKYNNVKSSGLGDFIRGSYFLMQFCKENNISYCINLSNHPISRFLEIYKDKPKQQLVDDDIKIFEKQNYNPIVLKNNIISNKYDNTINKDFFIFLSKQPHLDNSDKIIHVYCRSYPNNTIDDDHREIMRAILQPNDKLSSLINQKLETLNLVKKKYIVFHIRFGDDFLINKKMENNNLIKVKKVLDQLKNKDDSKDYLLISDNNIIKKYIKSKNPFIKTFFCDIVHTNNCSNKTIDSLQNTMIDFYLFAYATKIFSYSIYAHGSGFSKWCAETYNIPYTCQRL